LEVTIKCGATKYIAKKHSVSKCGTSVLYELLQVEFTEKNVFGKCFLCSQSNADGFLVRLSPVLRSFSITLTHERLCTQQLGVAGTSHTHTYPSITSSHSHRHSYIDTRVLTQCFNLQDKVC